MAKHKCAADGCKAEISLALEFCRECWRFIPRDLQRRILSSRLDRDRRRFERFLEQAKAHIRIGVDKSVEIGVDNPAGVAPGG